jgi:uncharacterized OB-fold protein
MTQIPFAEGLFTWPSDDPRLIGSRCAKCGVTTFPVQTFCPGCPSDTMEEVLLEPHGTLWTFTTQEFRPKEPYNGPEDPEGDWQPYGVGYIELGGEIRVESRLTESDASKLRIGMEMELRIVPFGTDENGNELVNFAFAPVGSEN